MSNNFSDTRENYNLVSPSSPPLSACNAAPTPSYGSVGAAIGAQVAAQYAWEAAAAQTQASTPEKIAKSVDPQGYFETQCKARKAVDNAMQVAYNYGRSDEAAQRSRDGALAEQNDKLARSFEMVEALINKLQLQYNDDLLRGHHADNRAGRVISVIDAIDRLAKSTFERKPLSLEKRFWIAFIRAIKVHAPLGDKQVFGEAGHSDRSVDYFSNRVVELLEKERIYNTLIQQNQKLKDNGKIA